MSATTLDSLASAHQKSSRHNRLISLMLLVPLLAYTSVFFVLPIGMMLYRAVANPEIAQAFPRTVKALALEQRTDKLSVPSNTVFEAIEQDFTHVENLGAIGEAARRLNYESSGYRTLVTATARRYQGAANQQAAAGDTARTRLAAIDPRWESPELWDAFERASPLYTSYYLLSAVDLKRTADGVQRVDPDKRVYVDLTLKTLKIAFVVSLLCLLLGFPFAVLLVKASRPFQLLLLLAVMLPFWTSLLARTTAWIVVLQEKGIINTLLINGGLIDQPLPMMFDALGVYIVMVHILLPFTVLPLYSAMKGIPEHYMRASASLGGHPIRGFWHVYLPMTMTGVGCATLLTFIVAAGYYITPTLVGSAREQMLGYFIAFYTNTTVNWGMASALGLVLIVCVTAIYLLAGRLVGIRQIAGLK